MNNRRAFLAQSIAAGLAAGTLLASETATAAKARRPALPRKFQCRYAPHFGMFKEHAGPDLIAQLEFMADQGFTALEDNGLMGRPRSEEHTSELQSQSNIVCRLLLEKKN